MIMANIIYFKVFQTANFMAAFLLLFEVGAVTIRRWKDYDWRGPSLSMPMFFVGAFAMIAMAVTTFLPRVFDDAVLWMKRELFAALSTNIATTLLFCVLFWFHHYARNGDSVDGVWNRWRYEHIAMAVVLTVSVAANIAELIRGGV